MLNQTNESNLRRVFGYIRGSVANLLLTHLRDNPDQWLSIDEATDKLKVKRISVEAAIFNGVNAGALQKRKRKGNAIEVAFLAMPEIKTVTWSKNETGGRTVTRVQIGRQSASLERAHRINLANPIKQPGDNTPVNHSDAQNVTVAENYPPHRYWTGPAKVPSIFRLIPLGATLEAA